MSLFEGTLYSEALGMMTCVTVSLPAASKYHSPNGEMPVLYLLHGQSDNHSAWVRRTNIDRYAEELGIAVIMPEVQRSFYTDMTYGLSYFTYIADELPRLCHQLFRVSDRREDMFIAGLSMGGYGAMKVALSRPERFAAAASFSGALNVRTFFPTDNPEFIGITGGNLPDKDDLFVLADQVAALGEASRPRLLMTCGLSDFLYKSNLEFRNQLDKAGISYSYEEWEGDHNWVFWDTSVQKALAFFLP
jgi:S-formylglutathione hydrolase FrmB